MSISYSATSTQTYSQSHENLVIKYNELRSANEELKCENMGLLTQQREYQIKINILTSQLEICKNIISQLMGTDM